MTKHPMATATTAPETIPPTETDVNPPTAAGVPETLWLVKSGKANKLGKYADGSIAYQVLASADRTILFIAITANDGGGYFSRERVAFNKIEECLAKCDISKPFPSKTFKEAFTGRSSNNAGFMVAILRAEGLLAASPEIETQHTTSGNWTNWQKTMLSEPGTLLEAAGIAQQTTTTDAAPAPPEHSDHKKTLKLPTSKKE